MDTGKLSLGQWVYGQAGEPTRECLSCCRQRVVARGPHWNVSAWAG